MKLRSLPIAALALSLGTGMCLLTAPAVAQSSGSDSLSGAYLAGIHAGKARDTDAAATYISRALQRDPDDPELIARAFMLELGRGDLKKATRLARRVVANEKRHRVARLVLALQSFQTGKQVKAREHLEHASYTPIGQLTSALLIGWSWAAEGKMEMAIKALKQLDSTESFSVYKTFHSGLIADFLNQPKRAAAFFERTYDDAGTSLRVVQAYGNFLERQGKPDEALKVYEKFDASTSGHPLVDEALNRAKTGGKAPKFINSGLHGAAEALFSLSSALADQSGVDLALLYAQSALQIRPQFAVAQTLLGDIYEDTKRYQHAIDAYKKVPTTSSLRPNADIRIAINYDRIGNFEEAEKRLTAQIEADGKSFKPALNLGNLLRGHEKFAKAAEFYTAAIAKLDKVETKHWTMFYFRGICYERSKQWPLAEADFKKALELRPEQPLVFNYLGYSWIEKGLNLKEALGMIERAVELRPNDGYIVDSLGWAHYKLRNYDLAAKHLERAVELKPQDPVINDHLGDAYWRVDRKLEARFQWQRARDNKPEADVLEIVMKKLKGGLAPEPAAPETVKQVPTENKT
ncbi:MAG: tetratricopeptide repeat protein [Alphaproteobacteria bacterium]|nr:tetratricopeptide repeat protein [Alphaproteobacteria bacterium]